MTGLAPSRLVVAVCLAVFCMHTCALKVHVWTNTTDPDFVWPEQSTTPFGMPQLMSKASLGVACSGGGWRAAPLCYGWLRELHKMGVLTKAQYLSANSGGGWVTTSYSFSGKAALEKFFGPYVDPANLTFAMLSSSHTAGSWGKAVSGKTLVPGLISNPVSVPGEPSGWATNVAFIFLQPFGLANPDSTVSATGTNGDILQATRARLNAGFAVNVACNDSRPYPVLVGAIMLPNKTASPRHFGVEFSLLYFGAPALHNGVRPIALGGGLAEPLALHTLSPRTKAVGITGNETVEVYLLRAGSASSLVHAMGISSSAIPLMMAPSNMLASNLLNGQSLNYWNLWDYKQSLLSFVDGGAVDDLGVMPLLRRSVKNIVVCLATHVNPNATMKDFAESEFALAGLFGMLPADSKDKNGQPLRVQGSVAPLTWNAISQVFPPDGFLELFDQFKASYLQGGAHVFNATYKVLPNSFLGVIGNYKVNVLWLLNGQSTQWEAALPKVTQQWLAPKRNATSGPYRGYPNVYNVLQAPVELVTLLSQQASWAVRTKQSLVQEWVAAAKCNT